MIAPTGYTVVLKNVGENVEYDTEQSVVEDVHALLAAIVNIDGKGYGGIFTSTAILIDHYDDLCCICEGEDHRYRRCRSLSGHRRSTRTIYH